MRDQNLALAAELPPANHFDGSQAEPAMMVSKDKNLLLADKQPGEDRSGCAALFMENWPAPPACDDEDQMDDLMKIEVRKWRLQTLLAVQPFGVPSLALAQTYEKMFGSPFNLRDFDCDNLIPELTTKMADIMIVQEPDETTPILFPQYPHDKILHDARLGLDFSRPNLDGDKCLGGAAAVAPFSSNSNDLILRAWLDRDLDFPEDVVMVGEPFDELCKISRATVPGSRGVYSATIVSSAGPDSVFIRLQTTSEVLERIRGLSAEIVDYFKQTKYPIDAYNVPEQFMTLNFPCLFYSAMDRTWTRCIIVGRSRSDSKVFVESIDFGGIYAINKIFLYLMPRKFLSIPRLTFEVSLAGIKPANGSSTWSKMAGPRIRCFSMTDYHLDILLLDLEKQQPASSKLMVLDEPTASSSSSANTSNGSNAGQDDSTDGAGEAGIVQLDNCKKKRFANRASYGAIIVDRNDPDQDICLNDILALETYAIEDQGQAKQLARIKPLLTSALEKLPRPINPLGPIPLEA